MTDPVSVIGTISACISIAQFIAEQVQKWIDAPRSIKAISDNSSSMQSFLSQLGDTIQIDTRAALTAPHLPGKSVKSAYETIRGCKEQLGEIERILYKILGQRRIDSKSSFENFEVRTRYVRYESDLGDLQASLKDYELHIVLVNSILMLNLQRQPVQMHPLDRREVDNLTMTVGLIWNTINSQTHTSKSRPTTPVPSSGSMNTEVDISPGGKRGPPSKGDIVPNLFDRGSIARVDRLNISTQALDARGFKWLNDPFDASLVNVYDVSDNELSRLIGKTEFSETNSSHHRERLSRFSNKEELAKLEMEEMKKMEGETRKKTKQSDLERAEMLRIEEEKIQKLRIMEQQELRRERSPIQQQFFGSDKELVNYILDSWELPSSSTEGQLKVPKSDNQQKPKSLSPRRLSANEKPYACNYVFRKGEPMYQCHDCAFRDQVFCRECFSSRDHADHRTMTTPAESSRSYCDCDPNEPARRDIICRTHKTKMLGSSAATR